MSRVHCLECGDQVVVDPRGLCPEGHEVGTVGSRIEQAMGHQAAHPDEPQPWVYRIDPDELDPADERRAGRSLLGATNGMAGSGANGGAGTNGSSATREARPVRVPGLPEEAFDDEPADAESLLRELHSLAALDSTLAEERGNGATNVQRHRSPAGPTPGAGSPPPPPPGVVAATPRPPRPDPSAMADAFAELNALDVPRAAMNETRPAPAAPLPPPATTPTTAPRVEAAETAAAELSSLFDDPPLFTGASRGAEAGADPAPPVDAAVVHTPPPSTPAPGAIDRASQHGDDVALELEAMFETAEPPSAAPAAQPRPEAAGHADDETAGDTAYTGQSPGLDLSSFTAKGKGGAGKGANRRRRFGR